ncbi:hypothetical protein QR680_004477 [Steinernema hermaphroditum]|uniref:Saposin B-type domain-containing protein n=1 Tax=Steinernema hermaphroditum TaxID=289476 RepID=A0AA39HNV6_9BILA|nr:hypothetical protein QR680_004477 [Steinernema hermaphroditum]
MAVKLSLIALVVLVAAVTADGPFCSTCQKMVDDVKAKHNNNFAGVNVDQLLSEMNSECDANFSGFTDSICKKIVKDNDAKLLAALQNGQSSYQVCQTGTLC